MDNIDLIHINIIDEMILGPLGVSLVVLSVEASWAPRQIAQRTCFSSRMITSRMDIVREAMPTMNGMSCLVLLTVCTLVIPATRIVYSMNKTKQIVTMSW